MHIILFGRGVSSKNNQQNLQHLKSEVTIQEIKESHLWEIDQKKNKRKTFEYILGIINKRNGKGMEWERDYFFLLLFWSGDIEITKKEIYIFFFSSGQKEVSM